MRTISKLWRNVLVAGTVLGVAACGGDPLDVKNPNNPETERVLSSPEDIESLIRSSYSRALDPLILSTPTGIPFQLWNLSFENSAWPANFGMFERSRFPRESIKNLVSDQYHPFTYKVWAGQYSAINSANQGLQRLDAGVTLGDATRNARARAFAKFVQGLGHMVLAITYDQAAIHDETVPAGEVRPLKPYAEVAAAGLASMTQAVTIAQANPGITFDVAWMGVDMDGATFARVVNSFKARFRAQMPRTPAEAATVNWAAVIAEVDAGITADYRVVDDDATWDFVIQDFIGFGSAWSQMPYWIYGMADQSGNYQRWLAVPLDQKHPNFNQDPTTPFLIVTPDLRYPRGADTVTQRANPGRYITLKKNLTGAGGWARPERGTWRWSHYFDTRYKAFYAALQVGLPMDVIRRTELDLLKAEALIRLNRQAEALPLINNSRVGTGGLVPATLTGAPDCVPKLPNGTCANLFETLKWEKRLEQFTYVYGGWYFDSRRWGDLTEKTFLHYPVPARELEVRQLPLYTFGGSEPGSAPAGTYGF